MDFRAPGRRPCMTLVQCHVRLQRMSTCTRTSYRDYRYYGFPNGSLGLGAQVASARPQASRGLPDHRGFFVYRAKRLNRSHRVGQAGKGNLYFLLSVENCLAGGTMSIRACCCLSFGYRYGYPTGVPEPGARG
jgi:hypothetical protein